MFLSGELHGQKSLVGYSKQNGVNCLGLPWRWTGGLCKGHSWLRSSRSSADGQSGGGPQGEEPACTKRQRPVRRAVQISSGTAGRSGGGDWTRGLVQTRGNRAGGSRSWNSGVQLWALWLRELVEAFQWGRAVISAHLCSRQVGFCSPHHLFHALAHTVHGEPSPNPLTKSYSSLRPNSRLNPGIKPFVTTPAQTFLLFRRCFHS